MISVYGYDAGKDVHIVEFTIDEVLNSGIDPWRLDLFDEDPIEVKGLLFSKLTRPFAFAYYNGHMQASYLGVFDGKEGTCLKAFGVCSDRKGWPGRGRGRLELRNAQTVPLPFSDKLGDYLRFRAHRDEEVATFITSDGSNIESRDGVLHFITDDGNQPVPEKMRSCILREGRFIGRTFDQIAVPMKSTSRELLWVFEALAEFEPIVFGHSLLYEVLGIEHSPHIRVAIRKVDSLAPLESAVKQAGGLICQDSYPKYGFNKQQSPFSFSVSGYVYHLAGNQRTAEELWKETDFSVHQLVATGPNQLIASRIALHDLAQKRIRLVSRDNVRVGQTTAKWFKEQSDGLRNNAFTEALPVHWHR